MLPVTLNRVSIYQRNTTPASIQNGRPLQNRLDNVDSSICFSSLFNPSPASSKARDAEFLVLAEPGLVRFAEDRAHDKVEEESEDDHDECNGVEVVDAVAKDLDADDYSPKGTCQ
jgi:hypothetical protein